VEDIPVYPHGCQGVTLLFSGKEGNTNYLGGGEKKKDHRVQAEKKKGMGVSVCVEKGMNVSRANSEKRESLRGGKNRIPCQPCGGLPIFSAKKRRQHFGREGRIQGGEERKKPSPP